MASQPPVEPKFPPELVLRVLNPLMRVLLRSPAHRLVSRRFMLLILTGRKTGRTYTIPVGRHQGEDGELLVHADGAWRVNLRGGADVHVVLDGREHAGHASFEEDPALVAAQYTASVDRLGHRKASMVGLKVNVDRSPTMDEVRPAVQGRGVATIRLLD